MDIYVNNLKKEGASKNLQEQIINNEKAIEIYEDHIIRLEEDNAEKIKEIDDFRRNIDGSYFMKLAEGSDLINAGVDVGLPYNGSALDLGAYENE